MAKPDAIKPIGQSKHIFLCLYGEPGCGKTRLITTLANSLVIRPPVEQTNSVVGHSAAGVEEWVVNSWDEMLGDVLEYVRHEGKNHSFVWLDSMSSWQDVGLDDVWADVIARRPDRRKGPVDKGEYGMNMTRISQWVRAVVGADVCNFGFTAWPETLEDPNGEMKSMPWVQGRNMSNKMVGYVQGCYYLERVTTKGETKRVLRTQEHEDYFVKDQFGIDRIVNPTMPKLLAAIEAKRPKKPATKTRKAAGTPARRRTRRTTSK
jgi:hypothetical protein